MCIIRMSVDCSREAVVLVWHGSCIYHCRTVDSWKPIADYVEKQFEQFYDDETGLNRHNIKDTRVHCCLYFIPPYGHG